MIEVATVRGAVYRLFDAVGIVEVHNYRYWWHPVKPHMRRRVRLCGSVEPRAIKDFVSSADLILLGGFSSRKGNTSYCSTIN